MPRNYNNGFPAFVTIGTVNPLKYGFKSRMQANAAAQAEVGVIQLTDAVLTAAFLQRFVLGCNSPKPPRATKRFASPTIATESTFVSTGNVDTARNAGWKIRPGKPYRRGGSTDLSQSFYVTINGIKYAWSAPRLPQGVTGQVNFESLGAMPATTADDDLVWGCSFPKPPVAGKLINDPEDDEPDKFSTFYDPDRTLPEGYYVVNRKGSNRRTLEDAKSMI